MKKLILILMTIFFVFAITGCPPDDDDDGEGFWAQDMKTEKFYWVKAEKLAEGSKCEVWAETGSGVNEAMAKNIAYEYDNNIYGKMMNTFGWTYHDEDLGTTLNTMQAAHYLATGTTDAKLTILLLNIKDNYPISSSYVAGYFAPINLFEYPYSNRRDMIYLDTYPSEPGSAESNGTLAHEMQHLMNFVSSWVYRFEDELELMDTWIDEGLSSAAERVYSGSHTMERVNWFNSNGKGSIKGKINVGNNFFVWGNRATNSDPYPVLDDYATVYLFFQWLRIQSNNTIYGAIIASDFSDYRAVTNAAKTIDSSYNNWSLLLRDWLAANYINSTSGRYGYKGELNVKAPMFPNTTISVPLFPGEGVYSKINSSETVPSSSDSVISYAGLNSTGDPVASGGSASGARLTYNTNTNIKGSSVTGNTTGIASSVDISTGRQIASGEFLGPYKVDAGFYLRRNENIGRYVGKSDKILKIDKSKIKKVEIDE